jgi:anti-sigma regulatory factor (Ser/Thr protein kinase)
MAGNEGPTPPHLNLELPATPESVTEARHKVAAYLQQLGMPRFGVEVAVTEAAKNAVQHAFRGDHLGSIWLEVETLVPDTLVVTVTDDGAGITPDLESDGLGLGLSLIGRFAHDFDVRDAEPHGTAVVMRFRLDAPDAPT